MYFTHSYGHLELAARSYPDARDRLVRINDRPTDHVVQLSNELLARADPTLRRRLEFAARAAASIAHRAVGDNVRFAETMGMDDAELVDEISRMVVAYIEVAIASE